MLSGLSRGLQILELLAREGRALPLGEIARGLGVSKSGAHGLLKTLVHRGFAARDEGGIYRLGAKAWEIGAAAQDAALVRVATPIMEDLVARINEGAILGVLAGFEGVYLHLVECAQAVRVHAQVEARIPAHCTSTGLALLAFQQEGYLDSVLPRSLPAVTPHTITDPAELRRELKRTRARGYAINMGGWREDVGGIAVPLLGADGAAIAGLCVAAPRYRMSKDWFRRVVPATTRAARAIVAGLGTPAEPRRGRAA
jgi:IclR family transcriptional regulator, KDG regulon repressor